MSILYAWLFVVTIGLGTELVFLGATLKDKDWFEQLGFREETQEVARAHAIIESVFVAILGIFLIVGLTAYAATPWPRPVVPISPARIITSTLFILAACALPLLSIYLRLRRKEMRAREEARQLEQLQAEIEAVPNS